MSKHLLLLFLFTFYIGSSLLAQLPSSYSDRLQFVLDSICEKYNIKGASAAVVVPAYGDWEGVYGDSYAGTPIDKDMILGLGSNTKTYVSSMMLRLQEQGLLGLDDTIGTWIQHPNVSGQITIRQLLNHTSGLYNYTNSSAWNNAVGMDIEAIWEPEDILQYISTPEFVAGSDWSYSNTNYLLAGLIAKNITGQNLSTALNNQILTPQGLNNTYLIPEESTAAVIPHIWSDAFSGSFLEDLIADYSYSHNAMMSAAWAAGGLVSTAKDNALFWSKLISGDVVNDSSWSEMTEFVSVPGTMDYGLGIMRRDNFNGHDVYSHGGTNLGFINENIADPETGVTISVLTNQDSISNSILLFKVVHALHNVTLDEATDIDETGLHTLSIYPNPANDFVYINVDQQQNMKLYVYDVMGRLLIEDELQQEKMLNVATLTNGSYILKLQAPGSTVSVQKLFIQH